jgi:hypothetical protein
VYVYGIIIFIIRKLGEWMSKKGFKIPYALDDDGNLIGREEAIKQHNYKCPECGSFVSIRCKESEKITTHFYHKVDIDSNCEPESVMHKIGKMILVNKLKDRSLKEVQIPCKNGIDCIPMTYTIPEYNNVGLERFSKQYSVQPDVDCYKEDSPVVFWEVFWTHRVDEKKARKIKAVPWIEFKAKSIIKGDFTACNTNIRYKCEECIKRNKCQEMLYNGRAQKIIRATKEDHFRGFLERRYCDILLVLHCFDNIDNIDFDGSESESEYIDNITTFFDNKFDPAKYISGGFCRSRHDSILVFIKSRKIFKSFVLLETYKGDCAIGDPTIYDYYDHKKYQSISVCLKNIEKNLNFLNEENLKIIKEIIKEREGVDYIIPYEKMNQRKDLCGRPYIMRFSESNFYCDICQLKKKIRTKERG